LWIIALQDIRVLASNWCASRELSQIHSFRDTFEDWLKEAGIDEELRQIPMGPAIDRPDRWNGVQDLLSSDGSLDTSQSVPT
jgi:hypothetical protein